jgi:hypothetical protein
MSEVQFQALDHHSILVVILGAYFVSSWERNLESGFL